MELISLAFLAQIIRISVPYALAALGGTFSERGGVVNIALEGILLMGAFASVAASVATGSAAVGALAGVLAGVAMAAIHGLVTLRFRADQIVAGVAINLLAVGLTRYLLRLLYDSSSNSPRTVGFTRPGWAQEGALWGFLGETVGNPLVVLTAALIVVAHVVLFRTPFGLRLRAVGEHPQAAQALGISVLGHRWSGVLASGALAGLGGVWLAFDQHQFVDLMSNGRGYIALAAMIFGNWRPAALTGACLLFGAAEALQIGLQSSGVGLPSPLVQMLPYVLTMVALAGVIRRSSPPSALGRPWEP